MSFYDAKLLRDVITVEGLIMTLAIPLALRQTVFSVYSADTVPMPQPEPQMAIKRTSSNRHILRYLKIRWSQYHSLRASLSNVWDRQDTEFAIRQELRSQAMDLAFPFCSRQQLKLSEIVRLSTKPSSSTKLRVRYLFYKFSNRRL